MTGDTDTHSEAAEILRSVSIIARALRVPEARTAPTIDAIVRLAGQSIGCEAGLILVERGVLVPQATTGQAPHLLDLRQQELGDGPCMEAATTQRLVSVPDTVAFAQWPDFCRSAVDLGVRSMLCVPLWVDDRGLGSLSLYADEPNAFGPRDQDITNTLATLAAVALAEAQRADQLREALQSRDVIGIAKGILMERHKISDDEAFQQLVRLSQRRNAKLVVVARYLAETGALLGED